MNLRGKFLSTLDYYFEDEIQDLIIDEKIIITKDEFGIYTFTFNNYEFIKDNYITLGSLKNATTYGILDVETNIPYLKGYSDEFNLNASVLIRVKCINNGFYTGILKVKVRGNGTYEVLGIVPTNIPLIKQELLLTQYIN